MGNVGNISGGATDIEYDTLRIIASTNKEVENLLKKRRLIKAKIKRCEREAEQMVADGEDKEAIRVLTEKRKFERDLSHNYGMTNRLKTMVEDAERMKNITDVKEKESEIAKILERYQKRSNPLTVMETNIALKEMHKDVDRVADLMAERIDEEDPFEDEELDEELLKIKKNQADKMIGGIKTPPNPVGGVKVSQKKPVKQESDIAELAGDIAM